MQDISQDYYTYPGKGIDATEYFRIVIVQIIDQYSYGVLPSCNFMVYSNRVSTEDSKPAKKMKSKKWKIFGVSFVALIVIGALAGEETTTSNPAPEASPEPTLEFSYSAEVTRWEPINPASGRAVFTIRNTGEVSFIPDTCTVRVQDDSLTYKGFDYVSGFTETIKPGAKFMANVVLTVTKEGAFFVTKGSVDCELKAVS